MNNLKILNFVSQVIYLYYALKMSKRKSKIQINVLIVIFI